MALSGFGRSPAAGGKAKETIEVSLYNIFYSLNALIQGSFAFLSIVLCFIIKSSMASSNNRLLGILVFNANSSNCAISSFFNDEVNLFLFHKLGSAICIPP